MQAFHNDIQIKKKYVSRVLAHQKADEIIQGTGWENGKGCAVGCTLENYSHEQYEVELGVPEWLAHLEDRIFEGLEKSEAMKFPAQFLEAINVGADLDKIKIPFLTFVVEAAREKTTNEKALKAIDGVLVELKREVLDLDKLKASRNTAHAAYAAYARKSEYKKFAATAAATYAAYATAAATYDDAATYAATYAAYTADAATYAAYTATYAATATVAAAADADADAAAGARNSEYKKFASKLLELLGECK